MTIKKLREEVEQTLREIFVEESLVLPLETSESSGRLAIKFDFLPAGSLIKIPRIFYIGEDGQTAFSSSGARQILEEIEFKERVLDKDEELKDFYARIFDKFIVNLGEISVPCILVEEVEILGEESHQELYEEFINALYKTNFSSLLEKENYFGLTEKEIIGDYFGNIGILGNKPICFDYAFYSN